MDLYWRSGIYRGEVECRTDQSRDSRCSWIFIYMYAIVQKFTISISPLIILVITNCKIIPDSECVSFSRFSNNIEVSIIYMYIFLNSQKEKKERVKFERIFFAIFISGNISNYYLMLSYSHLYP